MIIKETYVDANGKRHPKLLRIYSDLGVRLLQEDTGIVYPQSVIDSVNANHRYREMAEDLGDLPEELKESASDAEELDKLADLPFEGDKPIYNA